MAYSFKRRETARDGFHRIATEQLSNIKADLEDAGNPEAIHDARKSCMRLRSLLRLVRKGLPVKWRRDANRLFRDIGRLLGTARDAEVRLITFKHLISGPAAPLKDSVVGLQTMLELEAERARGTEAKSGRKVARAQALTRKAEKVLAAAPLSKSGWKLLGSGIKRSYRRGLDAFDHALTEPSPEAYHEWRKRCQTVWHHLRLLKLLDRKLLHPRVQLAESLCGLLGDENDLIVLQRYLAALPPEILAPEAGGDLEEIIVRRCNDLFRVSVKLGHLVFEDEPDEFEAIMKKRWKRWRR